MSIDAGDVEGDVVVRCDSAEAQAKVETPAFPGQGYCRLPQLLLSRRQTTTSPFSVLWAHISRLKAMPQVAKARRMGRLMICCQFCSKLHRSAAESTSDDCHIDENKPVTFTASGL